MPPISRPSTMAWASSLTSGPPGTRRRGPVRPPGRIWFGPVRAGRVRTAEGRWQGRGPDLSSLPWGLGVHDLVRGGGGGRRHDLDRAVLPLRQDERRLRLAGARPAQRTEDGLHLVAVQPVGELVLVERAHRRGRRLDDLARRERVG